MVGSAQLSIAGGVRRTAWHVALSVNASLADRDRVCLCLMMPSAAKVDEGSMASLTSALQSLPHLSTFSLLGKYIIVCCQDGCMIHQTDVGWVQT